MLVDRVAKGLIRRVLGDRIRIGFVLVICSVFQGSSAQTTTRITKPDSPAVANWKAQTASIKETLIENKLNCPDDRFDVHVLDAFGLGEDEPSVALVDFCSGGAYTDWIVVMHMEHGVPMIARFRNSHGGSIPNEFASGASVMHSVDVQLVPERKAVYDLFANNNSEGKLANCGVKAYRWNPNALTFDEDSRLSKVASDKYCRDIQRAE